MFRFLGWLIKTAVVSFLFTVATYVYRDAIARELVRSVASDLLGLPFEAQKVRFDSLLPLRFQVTGFLVQNPPDFPHNRLLAGRSIEVECDTVPWKGGRFHLRHVHWQIDELALAVAASGDNNLQRIDLLTLGPSSASWSARFIEVDQASFSVLRVLIYDYRTNPNPPPLIYKTIAVREELPRRSPLPETVRSLFEQILARTPTKLGRWVNSVSS